MTIRETLQEILLAQWVMIGELRAMRAVLEGPQQEVQPDLEALVSKAQSATELIRMGVLRRSR